MIIPTYNEADILERNVITIERLLSARFGTNYEIIVVEESTDKTAQVLELLMKKRKKIRRIHSEHRLGKGGAIERGILASKGENVAFADLDLATDFRSLPDLIKGLEKNDIVMGSRYLPGSSAERTLFRLAMSRIYIFLVKALLGLPYSDMQCGFKAFKKSEIKKILSETRNKSYFWDTELIFHAHKKGLKILEIPVKWHEVDEKSPGAVKMFLDLMRFRMHQSFSIKNSDA